MADLIAGVAGAAVILYALLGGADFGGGVWDLLARGPRRADQRAAIAHAMGPVWEANHVWLIFVIVILFTAFPSVYAALSIALFVPFHVVLLGIVLRGAAFVFRAYSRRAGAEVAAEERGWGVLFGAASIITPLLLGCCLAAVSTGRIRVAGDGITVEHNAAWLTPLALTTGLLALALCAYLAAVYLTNETKAELQEDFRGFALLAGTATVALSAILLLLVRSSASHLWSGLTSTRALPVLIAGVVAALFAGWTLRHRRFRAARAAAVTQISALLAGWMLAQYPYLIYPDVTVQSAAAPAATLRFFVWTLPLGALVLLPSLWLLFRVFKREALT
ncbi:MAG TPA: cytochrome d ubiquinol oxidase subunit II [Longimicrobiales bacterium]|nr:cytochrome d ubiquinol oxidase subunit II [Longimicrobiales bacterium]